jgi:hypothetical protein
VLLQNGDDVLEEVELFVAGARPEIVAMNDERLFFFVARFVDDGDAALLSERRIGRHHFVFAVIAGKRTQDLIRWSNSVNERLCNSSLRAFLNIIQTADHHIYPREDLKIIGGA